MSIKSHLLQLFPLYLFSWASAHSLLLQIVSSFIIRFKSSSHVFMYVFFQDVFPFVSFSFVKKNDTIFRFLVVTCSNSTQSDILFLIVTRCNFRNRNSIPLENTTGLLYNVNLNFCLLVRTLKIFSWYLKSFYSIVQCVQIDHCSLLDYKL